MQILTSEQSASKISDFTILNKLGTGAFSEVFKCVRKSDSKTYALKKVSFPDLIITSILSFHQLLI